MPPDFDSTSRPVLHIFTATFDIDKGPTVLHEYPVHTPSLDASLAFLPELVLPDQMHTRVEDATVFLLFRDPSSGALGFVREGTRVEPLYAYNVLQTRTDAALRRGAVIKSLCVVTRVPFFHILRPAMVVALDRYFGPEDPRALADLYGTLNAVRLLLVHARTRVPALRACALHSAALPSPAPYIAALRNTFAAPLLNLADDASCYRGSDATYETTIRMGALRLPLRVPAAPLPGALTATPLLPFLRAAMAAECFFAPLSGIVRAPRAASTDLLRTPPAAAVLNYGPATPAIIALINAVLCHKRVVVLGYLLPAQTVCDTVLHLAQVVGGGGLLLGLEARVFPFVDVSKVEVLEKLPCYIAGTANPIFREIATCWDVLWDLDANQVWVAREPQTPQAPQAPQTPQTPQAPQVPQAPQAPQAPQTPQTPQTLYSIVEEDAHFLTGLKEILRVNHDDVTTGLLCRRHVYALLRLMHAPDPPGEPHAYTLVRAQFLGNPGLVFTLEPARLPNANGVWLDVALALELLSTSRDTFYGSVLELLGEILHYLQGGGVMDAFLLTCQLLPARRRDIHTNAGMEALYTVMFDRDPRVRHTVLAVLQEIHLHPLGKVWANEMNGFYRNGYEVLVRSCAPTPTLI